MNRLYFVPECDSTQDEILAYLSHELQFCGLCTFNQTKGRGQYGNSWQSDKNQNIAMSFAVPSSEILLADSLFNYYTAVLIRDFVANMTQEAIKIKWPNDLILNAKKIAGILLERKKINAIPYFILGVGINILQQNFGENHHASSLYSQTGIEFDKQNFAENLFEYLEKNLFANPQNEEILKLFNRHLFRKDQISCFKRNDNRQNGIIKRADEDGFLWIEMENDGLQKFYHKEITILY